MTEVNYTDEMVARLREVYDPSADEDAREIQILALSEELGKNIRSIRAKLTREGVYVAKAAKAKADKLPTKAELVTQIATALEVQEEAVESLEKATKAALLRIVASLS